MILIASIQCHHGDTGGGVPGGYNVTANDIWGEGVRWPAVKVVDRGVERRDVLYALQVNNRIPSYIGDLRAQIGAAQLAAQRLGDLLDRYSSDTVEESVDFMIDYAARRFREEVTAWPDGVYEADAYVDHDPLGNPDVHLHVKITVDGEKLTIDYSGSDTRPELQAWSTFGNTRGYTVGQIASMMDPEIPKNEGFFDQIKLVVPEGCVLNPPPGKPVSAGTHHPGADVGEVIAVAMQHVLPDKAVPADLQDRASRRSSSASTRSPASPSPTTRPRSTRAGATPGRAWTRGARRTRASATCGRRRPRSTRASTRTCSGAGTTAPTPAGRASGAACAAATTRRKSSSTRRSTRTWSA